MVCTGPHSGRAGGALIAQLKVSTARDAVYRRFDRNLGLCLNIDSSAVGGQDGARAGQNDGAREKLHFARKKL